MQELKKNEITYVTSDDEAKALVKDFIESIVGYDEFINPFTDGLFNMCHDYYKTEKIVGVTFTTEYDFENVHLIVSDYDAETFKEKVKPDVFFKAFTACELYHEGRDCRFPSLLIHKDNYNLSDYDLYWYHRPDKTPTREQTIERLKNEGKEFIQ